MSSSQCINVDVFSLLILTVLFHSVTPNVFFPVETNIDLVHYRSLKDILFRSQSEDIIAHSIESPVVASFRPANPSPTLASSPQNAVGVSKIRFLEADTFLVPNFSPVSHSEVIPSAIIQTEGRRATLPNSDFDHTTVVRQVKNAEIKESANSATANPVQDRWPWPYSKSISSKQSVNPQSRQLQQPSTLIVKKSVAKPYRLLTRTSSCPKLLHDLTITCSLPKQQQIQQPMEFQWYKTQHRSVAETQNNFLESTIKTPIAFGTQMIHKDSRYGVSVVSDSANLTIRQLKPQDCGSYICEAVDVHNATVISNTEFLIFLCY